MARSVAQVRASACPRAVRKSIADVAEEVAHITWFAQSAHTAPSGSCFEPFRSLDSTGILTRTDEFPVCYGLYV
jgi:hypothetical protein